MTLAWLYLRVGLMNELQYRANFVIQLLQSVVATGTGLIVLGLIFERTDHLEGWTRPQLLVVMGVFTIMGGIIGFAIEPNMGRLMSDVTGMYTLFVSRTHHTSPNNESAPSTSTSNESVDDDFVGCLAGNLRAAARVATRAYDAALRPHGVRITQVAVMATLARLQPVTVTELAVELASERSAVARDVAILERSGFVAGAAKADDLRAREMSLTEKGRRTLDDCAPAWRQAQAEMRERLGERRVHELIELSRQLITALSS